MVDRLQGANMVKLQVITIISLQTLLSIALVLV